MLKKIITETKMDIKGEKKENFRRHKSNEMETLELKSTISEKKIFLSTQMYLIAIWMIKQKGSLNLRTGQKKFSKMKNREKEIKRKIEIERMEHFSVHLLKLP